MTYSSEDVARIAWLAAMIARDFDGSDWENQDHFLDYCANLAINRFWDQELSEKSETVTYTINGKEFQGVAGTVLTFDALAKLAGVPNADTCIFKRKRAQARDGLLRHDQTVKLQGGMAVTIVNTGSA